MQFAKIRARGLAAILKSSSPLILFMLSMMSAAAVLAATCDDDLLHSIQLDTARQAARYTQMGGQGIRPGNESQFRVGTNGRAVLVLHGFLASPFEVQSVAERLNKEGYTVYSPLVFGFGTTAEVANQVSMTDFRDSVATGYSRLAQCYSQISIVGMSWGGGLANDFVLNDPRGANVQTLILLSPYLKAKQWDAEQINKWTSKYLDVLPSWVAGLTAPNDHRAFKLYPQFHTRALPLLTVIKSLEFCDSLPSLDTARENAGRPLVSQVPTWLVTTDADETVDPEFARTYTAAHYAHLKTFNYPAPLKIPHQVPIAAVNPRLDTMLDWISAAFRGN